MIKTLRKIITIDETKCSGCGLCAQTCAEGAISIINGKAKLISETYCDGLGACLGECPEGAITMEEREAALFNENAVQKHLTATKDLLPCGCPGTQVRDLRNNGKSIENNCPANKTAKFSSTENLPSQLSNWPVQISLIPVNAPYLKSAHLIISADCVSYAFANFHNRFLPGKVLLVGCPKLDDSEAYQKKLVQIFSLNDLKSIEVAYMEVPCCSGLVKLVENALKDTSKKIPLTLTKIGINGEILETKIF